MIRPAAPRRRARIEPLERRAYLASATVSFGSPVSFAAGTAPVAIASGDFNADGHADLVVADATAEKASVFFGTGTGTFTPGPVLPLTAPPTAIVVGDFNGDGRPDLAVAASPGGGVGGTSVTVFLNAGGGTFGLGQATTVEPTAGSTDDVAIAAADFNADGHLDLVATDPTAGAVSILLGTGSGKFAAPVSHNVGDDPTAVAVGDFNKDGKPDVAVTATLSASSGTTTGASSDGVLTLLGDGTGQFTAGSVTPLTATGSSALVAGDLTGDGRAIDLAVGNVDGTVTLLVDNGADTFTVAADPTVAAAPSGLAIADLNLDGHDDVASADGGASGTAGTDTVTVLPGAGTGTLAPAVPVTTAAVPAGLVVADFNGDGKPDLATANRDAGTVSVLLNTTAVTTIATKTTLAVSPASAPAGSPVTLTATVTPASASPLTGESAPTGSVNFYDGSTPLGTATLAAGTGATATTALTVTTLTVGPHKLYAKYSADTAYAASGSAAAAETVTATATSGPDLTAAFSTIALPATVATGEAGSVKIKITNAGNATATGPITNALYLSLDGTPDPADTPVTVKGALAKTTLKLAPGKSVTLTGTFTVPASVPLGSYLLLADVDADGGVSQSTTANDVAASPTTYNVVDQFGTVGGKKGVALPVTDQSGRTGTFRLTGPGTGTVTVGDDGVDLSLAGTTAATAVTVAPAAGGGTFVLHDVTAAAAVGKITAPSVGIDAGAISLATTAQAISLGTVIGSTLTAGGGVGTLAVAGWDTGTVSAPWITTLRSAGAFGPSVQLTADRATLGQVPHGNVLSTFTVGGNDAAAVTAAVGRIGTVTLTGGMTGTVTADDQSIQSITVRGTVAAGVRFTAEQFPRRAVLGNAAVDPATDDHFQLTPASELDPLAIGNGRRVGPVVRR